MPELTEKYNWVDQEYVTDPKGNFVQVYRDRWWLVNDQDQVCLYRHFKGDPLSPQCNADREIAGNAKHVPGAVGVKQIPLAFVTINPRDY